MKSGGNADYLKRKPSLRIGIAEAKILVLLGNNPLSFTLQILRLPLEFLVNIVDEPIFTRFGFLHEAK